MSVRRHRTRRLLLSALLMVGYALSTSAPASAHAELEMSQPAAGAVVATSPERIVLRWNEEVTTTPEQLIVIDGQGRTVTTDIEIGSDGNQAIIVPDAPLGTGRWTVSWKAVSGDGHLVSGAFIFAVGDVVLGSGETTAVSGSAVGAADRVLETMSWLALLIAIGATWARRGRIAAMMAAFSAASVAARITMFIDAYGTGFITTVNAVGEVRSAVAVGAGALGVAAATVSRSTIAGRVAVTAGLSGFVAQGVFSGHHLDFDHGVAAVATIAHLSHLFAGAVWVSAVIALVFDRSPEQLQQVTRRATVAVGVLFPSALALALLLGMPVDQDGGGAWVTNLVVKAGLVVAAFALGAAHHRAVTRGGVVRVSTVLVELAVMATVFAASATLTQHTPPAVLRAAVDDTHAATTTTPATAAQERGRDIEVLGTFDDGSTVTLQIPAQGGSGDGMWMLDLRTADGSPFLAQTLQATASNPDVDVEDLPLSFTGTGEHWMGMNTLPFPGRWKVSIEAFIDDFTVVNAHLDVDVPAGIRS